MGNYVTVEDVRKYIGAEATADDTLLGALIDGAEAWINEECGFVFNADSNTDKTLDALDNVEGDTLYLDTWLYSLNTITNGDATTITSGQVILEPRTGPPYYAIKIRSDQSISWTYDDYHEGAITVNGAWGFSDEAPAHLQYAIKRLVKHWNHSRQNSGDLDRPLLTGDGVLIMPTSIPKDVQEIVHSYIPQVMFG